VSLGATPEQELSRPEDAARCKATRIFVQSLGLRLDRGPIPTSTPRLCITGHRTASAHKLNRPKGIKAERGTEESGKKDAGGLSKISIQSSGGSFRVLKGRNSHSHFKEIDTGDQKRPSGWRSSVDAFRLHLQGACRTGWINAPTVSCGHWCSCLGRGKSIQPLGLLFIQGNPYKVDSLDRLSTVQTPAVLLQQLRICWGCCSSRRHLGWPKRTSQNAPTASALLSLRSIALRWLSARGSRQAEKVGEGPSHPPHMSSNAVTGPEEAV